VADDDHVLFIDNDWFPKSVLPDRRGHGIDAGVVDPRVVLVRPDRADRAFDDLARRSSAEETRPQAETD
jgi:hypothetical protein